MSAIETSSLKPLKYVGYGILGFGIVVLFGLLINTHSTNFDLNGIGWTNIGILWFPLVIGTFLIYLGRK